MDALNYLLLVNIYLVLFYAFYALLLKNETFFKLNRIYLVGGACMSFLIPFLQSDWIRSLFITKQVEEVTQNISLTFSSQPLIIQAEEKSWETGDVILFIYLAGATLCLLRFLWQLYKVQAVLKSGETEQALSFFHQVKVGSAVPNRDTVFDHEMVHARQWHSADVILFEIIGIIAWFNPVVYLYRKAIKHIHEFTADEIAANSEESKTAYAMLLLSKTFGISTHQLTNSFYNQSLLKRRIIMLHKSKSTRNALLKYGLSAPLFAAMMILSSATFDERVEHKDIAENNGRDISYQELESFANKVLSADTTKGNVIFTSVEVSPEFPGGMKAFYEYLAKNVRYPDEAKKNNVSGKVIVQFVVERDGQLSEIKVLRGLGSGLDEEAARVLRASPNWKPGIQNGKPVRVAYTLPISFNTISKSGSQKASNQTGTVSPGSMEAKKAVTMLMSDKLPSNAIYIINGKKYNVKEGKEILKAISPNDIESINVIKADKIVTGSEEQGKNGIIEIILKKK